MTQAFTNWREIEQARNLAAVLAGLATGERLLVWCGNGHASSYAGDGWTSMGHHFAALVAEGAGDGGGLIGGQEHGRGRYLSSRESGAAAAWHPTALAAP